MPLRALLLIVSLSSFALGGCGDEHSPAKAPDPPTSNKDIFIRFYEDSYASIELSPSKLSASARAARYDKTLYRDAEELKQAVIAHLYSELPKGTKKSEVRRYFQSFSGNCGFNAQHSVTKYHSYTCGFRRNIPFPGKFRFDPQDKTEDQIQTALDMWDAKSLTELYAKYDEAGPYLLWEIVVVFPSSKNDQVELLEIVNAKILFPVT